MHLVVIGLNHKTAPVEVREKLAVSERQLPEALARLKSTSGVIECCILSTCNRTEVYAVNERHEDEETLIEFMSAYHDIDRAAFKSNIYCHRGHKAAEHLFSVASGIDSMMVGEDQILSQVKNAFCTAGECDTTKTILNTLFKQALTVGKRARSETGISRGAFSVGYAAVELAKSIFGNLAGRSILTLGAGKMGELTAKHLVNAGASSLIVCNRSMDRAVELAVKLGGQVVSFEDLRDAITRADVAICSTSSPEPVISGKQMTEIMRQRKDQPIFLIDIAVPRDVEPSVGTMDNVYLYDIDDLQSLVQASIEERRKEIDRVREIITEEVRKFSSWMRTLEAVPMIKLLRSKLEGLMEAEWDRHQGKLSHLGKEDREIIQGMMQSLINKVCHNPLIKMKEYASSTDGLEKLDTARELFGIEVEMVESGETEAET